MNINPNLSGSENIIAQATDSAFTAPTNPNDVAVGIPLPYPPPNPVFRLQGVNVDGDNSNTMVKVFVRAKLEDVNEDGENQTIVYERTSLANVVHPMVSIPSGLAAIEALNAIARGLGVVASELAFTQPYVSGQGSYAVNAITNSLLYIPLSSMTVTVNYSD